jgi:hypothetical protein
MAFLPERFTGCGLQSAEPWEHGKIRAQEVCRLTFDFVHTEKARMGIALEDVPGYHADPPIRGVCRLHLGGTTGRRCETRLGAGLPVVLFPLG